MQAAKLAKGDQFLAIQPRHVEERIKLLEAVADVEVRKTFPGKVEIIVEEHPHVANEQLVDGQWAALLANGQTIGNLSIQSNPAYLNKPVLSGWQGEPELKSQLTSALAALPEETVQDVSEILPNPSTSYADRILIYTRSGHEVVTTIDKLADKLPFLTGVVHELKEKGTARARITMLEAITSETIEEQSEGEEMTEGNERE